MIDNESPMAYAARMQHSLSPSETVKLWEKALTVLPNNPNVKFGLAKCYSMQDRYSDAEHYFTQATDASPKNAVFHLFRIRNMRPLENTVTTRSKLLKLVETFPDNGIIRHEAAVFYQEQKQFDEALNILKPVLDDKADNKAWCLCSFRTADILKNQGKFNEAEKTLLSLLQIKGEYPPALNTLLTLPYNENRFQRLKSIYEQLSNKNPSSFDHFLRQYKFYKMYDHDDLAEESQKHFRQHCELFKGLKPSLSNVLEHTKTQNLTSYFNPSIWRCWRMTDFPEKKWAEWTSDIALRQSTRMIAWQYFAAFPNSDDALADVVHPPNNYENLNAVADNQPILIAGNHQPPTSLLTRFMETYYPKFCSLTYSPNNLICQTGRHFTISDSTKTNVKMLLEKLSQGYMLGIGPDTPKMDNAVYAPFQGGEILLSTLIPRLVYKHSIPSYALLPYLQDNKYGFDLVALPAPNQNEPRNDFIQRWCKDYLTEYEKPLKSSGRLINAKSVSWSTMRFPDQSVLSY